MRMTAKVVRLSIVAGVAYGLAGTSLGDIRQRVAAQAGPTRMLTVGKPRDVRDMGATYAWLERKASRVTAKYAGGTVVAERSIAGGVKARALDRAGNEVATLRVQHGAGGGLPAFDFQSTDGRKTSAVMRAGLEPTLDWAALQNHALIDDNGAGRATEWQGRFVRARGAAARDVDDDPLEVGTEFTDSVKATTKRRFRTVDAAMKSPHAYYVTTVKVHDLEVGTVEWYPSTQTLSWNFPGLTVGYVDAKRLARYHGWTFAPSMAWANVQGLAFYQFHARLKAEGPIAAATPRGPFGRLIDAIVPTLHADEGCDYLHWLDGSILRPCCDEHDRCYATYGCNELSWFDWSISNWACESCNMTVAFCFVTGGNYGAGSGNGSGNGGDPSRNTTACRYPGESCSFMGDNCCDGSDCAEGFCQGG